jgi:hypothetical protein
MWSSCTRLGANVMRRDSVWMMDDTFYTAPKPYFQVT